jgi:hypothetical protein
MEGHPNIGLECYKVGAVSFDKFPFGEIARDTVVTVPLIGCSLVCLALLSLAAQPCDQGRSSEFIQRINCTKMAFTHEISYY